MAAGSSGSVAQAAVVGQGRRRRWYAEARAQLGDLLGSADRSTRWILFGFCLFQVAGIFWDQPCFYGWENDGAAPRDFFGGLADNLTPGKTHRYPLFHYFLIGLVSIPVLVADAAWAAATGRPILDVVISVPSMTLIATLTKVLHILMTCIGLLAAMRVWRAQFDATTARWALLFTVTNLTVAYYGRVTNVDAAYLMWIALALDRLVILSRSGAWSDYVWFAFFVAASMATKDQAYATFALVGPLYMIALPALRPAIMAAGRRHFPRLAGAAALGAVFYLVLSGAAFNPTGFVARIGVLTGTNSQDWRQYAADGAGLLANVRDLVRWQSDFFWPLAVVITAWMGVLLGVSGFLPERLRSTTGAGFHRWWRALPFVAGVSTVAAFTLVVARAEHRFMLVFGFWLSGYAGVAVVAFREVLRRGRVGWLGAIISGALVALGVAQNAELLVTQWSDPRREVERFLAGVSAGTRVETYGLGVYLPRFDLGPNAPYRTTRVSASAWGKPPPISGLNEVAHDFMNYEARAPDLIVVPEGFLNRFRRRSAPKLGRAMDKYRNAPGAMPFFSKIVENDLPGYRLLEVGQLRSPGWFRGLGGRLMEVHGSTGRRVWVFARDRGAGVPGRP